MNWPPRSCIHSRQKRVLHFDTELRLKPEPNVDCLSFPTDSKARTSFARRSIGSRHPLRMRRLDEREQELPRPDKFRWHRRGKREPKQRSCGRRKHSAICGNGDRQFEHGGDLERERRGLQRCSVWYHFGWRTLHRTSQCTLACNTPRESDQRGGPNEIGFGEHYVSRGDCGFAKH